MNLMWEYSFLGLYGLTLALSLLRFSRYYHTPLRYLPVVLAYTLITEILGAMVRDSEDYSLFAEALYINNNWLIFNLYALLQFGFFFWVFHRYLRAFAVGWFKAAGIFLFVLACIVNALYYDFSTVSQVYAYGTGGVILCILSVLYLLQEFQKAPGAARRNLLVWLSLGFLIFNVIYIPLKYFRFQVVHAGWEYYPWIRPLHLAAIWVMYGCIAFGLLIMKPMKPPGLPGLKS